MKCKCGIEVTLENMGRTPRECKSCYNRYMREYRNSNRSQVNESSRQSIARKRGTDYIEIEERKYYRKTYPGVSWYRPYR